MNERFIILRAYWRCHSGPVLTIVLLLMAADAGLSAASDISVPSANPAGYVTVPLALQVPLILAALLVSGVMSGSMSRFESQAALCYWPVRNSFYVGYGLAALVSVSVPILIAGGSGLSVVLMRAFAIWFGIATISGRLFGWRLAWILPLASFLPIDYFGANSVGTFYWWYWPRQPAGNLPCALIAIASILFGLASLYMTGWRIISLRRAICARLRVIKRAWSTSR
jgi:hypothetical protein